jgi:DNA-directed RNA polymerase I, II, and III subunit RPABC1
MTEEDKQHYALKVLSEMLDDRGYQIEYCYHTDQTEEEREYVIKAFHKSSHKNILCFMSKDDKLTIQGIKDCISIMNKDDTDRCIIVYRSSVTSGAKKSLETIEYKFELFGLHELQLNITHHRLVPRHQKVTPEEKTELDKSYKGKLPIILHTDPICRYYAFQKGDYIRITRKNGTIHYRIVK